MLSRFTPPSLTPTITVKWNREKYVYIDICFFHANRCTHRLRLPLPEPDSKISALRNSIAEKTGLEPSAFKLVYSGGLIKDNNASISSVGIKKGSKLVIIDGGAHANGQGAPERREKKEKPTTEEGSKTYIRDEMQRITQSLAPALDTFLTAIDATTTPSTSSNLMPTASLSTPAPLPSSAPTSQLSLSEIDYEHRRLNEEFIQALLRLDELHLESEWEGARSDRKGAVKSVQALLDRLDKGWRERSERLAVQ